MSIEKSKYKKQYAISYLNWNNERVIASRTISNNKVKTKKQKHFYIGGGSRNPRFITLDSKKKYTYDKS